MGKKYDVVVEAVRYEPQGQIRFLRVYERRGPTFTDRILLNRQQVINRFKEGKKFMVGTRMPQLASTFVVTEPVRLVSTDGRDVITTAEGTPELDNLKGVPVF